ncbi:MAG: hypothetical protein FJ147_09875 [Deltaproteobacteria bacterium]|nr:hypothetical protein [Deltaproteobacteria bacterium]
MFLLPSRSWSIIALRPDLEIEGFVQAQNILRTPKFQGAKFILQRNTAQVEAKYHFLQEGRAFGWLPTGPFEDASLTVIGRGVYDSLYDIGDAYSDKFTQQEKIKRKFEYKLREVYLDTALPPFSLRVGRQQIVWGETDNFRALDVINPLDLRWHWSRESWEDIRIPLWMVRAIYDIGKAGPLEESFVEAVWIPWDFQRGKTTTDPRRPWAFIGGGLRAVANSAIINNQLYDLRVTVRDRKPDRGLESSQGGVRFKGIWRGIDFSFNYFFTFGDTGVKVRPDLSSRVDGLTPSGAVGTFNSTINLVNARAHVVGFAANYSEEKYTQSVFRVEAALATGVPVRLGRFAGPLPSRFDPDSNRFETANRTVVMLAFDRPTWIRPLNKIRTFFLSGQFFWRHYLDYNRFYRGASSVRRAIIDDRIIPDRFTSVNTDRITQNEFVMTFSASTSYGPGGLWQPLFVVAYDPKATAGYNRLSMDYLFSNHLIIRLTQDFYWGKSYEGPWSIGDRFGRSRDSRHETILSVIFQF